MVATVRCEEIANEKYMRLANDKVDKHHCVCHLSVWMSALFVLWYFLIMIQSWLELEKAIQAGPISGFGEKLSSILETFFSE